MNMLIQMNVNEQEATVSFAGKLHEITWGTGAECGWYLDKEWICPLDADIFQVLGVVTRKLYDRSKG